MLLKGDTDHSKRKLRPVTQTWKLIDCIKREQSYNEVQIEQLPSEVKPGISKKGYRDTAERLNFFAKSFNSDRILEYLLGVLNNLAF